MKGVVFVELLSMAETLIGEDAVDDVLDATELASGGAYSAVGNYPCSELMALVGAFSAHTGHSVAFLQTTFGKWIFDKFAESYTVFFEGKTDAFTMLESIEGEVHVEVRKLYPEVELPRFETNRVDANTLEMVYASERPLVDFCQGMIEACLIHFGQEAVIEQTPVNLGEAFGAKFNISLTAKMAA
ncbi:heme NO-binding domain-containing protein [Alphaproteobacteria bacterium KMM 3653]|uniref:Heme NO-binding domain-containing protein n=1 Tax=Harenicola maris TaxID=2841044 RepID=A0AAP2CVM5_9RHOB|nr:heme NO-binding domain-containing protein [Harenicola maris]